MAPQEIDLTKKQKRKHHSVTYYAFIVSIGSAMSGYCSGVMSGAVLFIRADLKTTEAQEEMLIGSLIIISIVGGIIAGLLADKIGRKKTLMVAAMIVMVGCSTMALSPSYSVLFLGRLFTGIGYGFPIAVTPLYIAEISPPERRGRLLSIPEIFVNSGILLGYVSSFCLSTLPIAINWRLMLGLGGALAIALALGALIIPESPRWLVLQDRVDEAFDILVANSADEQEAERRLAKIIAAADQDDDHLLHPSDGVADAESADLTKLPPSPALTLSSSRSTVGRTTAMPDATTAIAITHPLLHDHHTKHMHEHQLEDAWGELLCPRPDVRRALLASLGLQFFQQASGIAAILYYLPSIFDKMQFNTTSGNLGATVAVGVAKTLFISVATAFLDRSGRKPLLFISGVGMALSMATLGAGFSILDMILASEATGRFSAKLPGVLALCSSCSFVAFFSMGMGPISSMLPSELFPLRLRAQGLSLSVAFNRLLSGIISLSFLSIMKLLTPAATFFVFAGVSGLFIPFVYFIIPETKGKILEEIKA